MDLGALVCTPRSPTCPLCPLAQVCEAYELDIQESLPVRPPRKPVPHYDVAAGVIWKKQGSNAFLVTQRPREGLLGGLWEFPGGKREPGETLPQCLQREIKEELGLNIRVEASLVAIEHAYTHFRITLKAYHAYRDPPTPPQALAVADWQWITLDQINDYAFSAADHKIIAALRANNTQSG
jgi:A/G-specific adenine glycosylase